jgi:hypothetical protein
MTGLIDDTADYWKARDVTVRRWFKDDNGRYAFRITVRLPDVPGKSDFYVTARSYMQTPIGCMKKLVARAADADALLLVRVGDDEVSGDPDFYVFDPATVLQHGDDRTADDQRAQRGERWVDFHPRWGVNLQHYAVGAADPAPPNADIPPVPTPDDDQTTATDGSGATLDDYGG